ncbi:MAG: twin-arginine translocation signal domain-containing protein [Sulfolobales archaeon]
MKTLRLTRREFLTLLGVTAVATSVTTLTRRSSPVEEMEKLLSEYNVADTYSVPSICGMCMAQ